MKRAYAMTDEERRIEEAMDAYFDKFGTNYPLCPTEDYDDGIVDKINECIRKGEPAPTPVYKEDMIY